MEGIEEIFPKLDEVPWTIRETLQEMVNFYLEAVEKKKHKLDKYMSKSHLFTIEDGQGEICCIFKKYVLEDSARKDVTVYLLDHPPLGHRSTSSALFGLSGVPPTVFIRTKEGFGCLVKFLKCNGDVSKFQDSAFPQFRDGLKTLPEEIQKICVTHIRFGCSDAHEGNTLFTRDASGIDRLTVIDNEECLTNYKLRVLWWANKKEADEDFSSGMVRYVRELNVDKDIFFLKKTGWEPPPALVTRFRVFTEFLKIAVDNQLKPKDIGLLALGQYRLHPNWNLQQMVNDADRKNGDEMFLKTARSKMEEGLKEYAKKTYKRNVGEKKPKR